MTESFIQNNAVNSHITIEITWYPELGDFVERMLSTQSEDRPDHKEVDSKADNLMTKSRRRKLCRERTRWACAYIMCLSELSVITVYLVSDLLGFVAPVCMVNNFVTDNFHYLKSKPMFVGVRVNNWAEVRFKVLLLRPGVRFVVQILYTLSMIRNIDISIIQNHRHQ